MLIEIVPIEIVPPLLENEATMDFVALYSAAAESTEIQFSPLNVEELPMLDN